MTGKQLKNSILQWAIQGKLVPQDPNDEPASVLLEKIRAEKERLVKEGKLKKKDLEVKPIAEDEIPFEIPKGWEWCRIKEIFSMQAGKFVSANDISNEQTSEYKYPCYGGNGLRGYVKKYNNEGHFTLVGRQGALCGNVQMAKGQFYATEHAVVTDGFGQTEVRWAYYFLTALKLNQYATATAQPGLAVSNILEVLIPLPPLAEQHRIVAKIEELMPLVEKYSETQEALEEWNNSLPEKLKKSILQEAIQGKLVPQDPADEPASALLERIREEKQRLVKEGKLKKKDLEVKPIEEDEIPFEIPKSWEWCHFGEIVNMQMGKTPPRGESLYWQDETDSWVSISDMKDYGHIKTTKERVSKYAVDRIFKKKSPQGTLLMSFKLTVGRTSILDISAFHNEAIISIYPYIDKDNSFRNYLFYLLPLLSNLGDSKDAIKGKTLNSSSLNDLLIPLPPLAEQRRIVAKIEELFGVIGKK